MPGTIVSGNLSKYGTIPTGEWVVVVSNATSTASTSTELLNPLSTTKTVSKVLKFGPEVRRGKIRARYELAISAAGTSPVIRVFGIYATHAQFDAAQSGSGTSTSWPTDGSVQVKRLDANSSTATGQTVTLVPGSSGDLRDSTYKYSNPIQISGSEWIDFDNAAGLIVLVETAASVTGGTPVVEIQVLVAD